MKNKILGARFSLKDVEIVEEICQSRGEDVSDFLRRATKRELGRLNYLSNEEKKALEIV